MTVVALEQHSTPAALAIRPGQEMWTDKQRAALAALGAKDAPNADLAVFMHYCQKTGLDPFSRQIYLIKRRVKEFGQYVDKWTIQVGIDGFRVIRDRVAERLGVTVEYEDTIWYDRDGGEHKIWLREDEPAGCNVTVLKDGRRFPGVVRFSSYAARKDGELVSQWKTQPDHMIEKCAEAFALRRAFPNDLGGLYIDEEMPPMEPGQAVVRSRGRVTVAEVVSRPVAKAAAPAEPDDGSEDSAVPGTASGAQVTGLIALFGNQFGFRPDEAERVMAICEQMTGRELTGPNDGRTLANLSAGEVVKLRDTLESIDGRDALAERLANPMLPVEDPPGGSNG